MKANPLTTQTDMNSTAWDTCCDPNQMLAYLGGKAILAVPARTARLDAGKVTDRKLQLFACACCRRIWKSLGEWEKRLIEVAERYAEGIARPSEAFEVWMMDLPRGDGYHAATAALMFGSGNPAAFAMNHAFDIARYAAGVPAEECESFNRVERKYQCDLLRDVVGNPFRPFDFDPSWRTSTVTALAQEMYETWDFSSMPILADALQDAGCENTEVLDHCREPAPRTRGCYVVDLALKKR